MTEPKDTPRCGEKAQHFRLTCDRPRGHVRSGSPDDWHEASSTVEQREDTQGWALTMSTTETARWAPHPWDIPGADPADAL